MSGILTSARLKLGEVYTRNELRQLFKISASSINNGIFKPAAYDSVWIFVTEQKTADRTQYDDILEGDVLHMDGQLKGVTDHLIKEHVSRGLELLLFYRTKKYEHPHAGFTYQGRFLYESHQSAAPTKFTLHRELGIASAMVDIEAKLETQTAFDPTDLFDARERTLTSIVRRRGQSSFRKKLLNAYSKKCAVTGCTIETLLEAAHIAPYLGDETNVVTNGLLLRADIHTLFDLGLLWVEPDSFVVGIAAELKRSEYGPLDNKPLSLPSATADRPSAKALHSRLKTSRMS